MPSQPTQYNSNSGGVGFVGALLLLFIALKLTGVIDWSWWWVLSPMWIGILLAVVIVVLVLVVGATYKKWSKWQRDRKREEEQQKRRDQNR